MSGHLELAERTGATIAIAANSGATYPHWPLHDADELALGEAVLKVTATPGHTEESISILALEAGEPKAVFTGDTLFIGDVGRPDLSPTRTPEELAAMLFDSLHEKLLKLPGETIVYPAHGAGSLCGRAIGDDASSTIDRERRTNYALQPMTPRRLRPTCSPAICRRDPPTFRTKSPATALAPRRFEDLTPVRELSPDEVAAQQTNAAVLLDTCPWAQFAAAPHLRFDKHRARRPVSPRGLPASSGPAPGADRPDRRRPRPPSMNPACASLASEFENIAGSLAGGIMAWINADKPHAGKPDQSIDQIAAADLSDWHESSPHHQILDVRECAERSSRRNPGLDLHPAPWSSAPASSISTATRPSPSTAAEATAAP